MYCSPVRESKVVCAPFALSFPTLYLLACAPSVGSSAAAEELRGFAQCLQGAERPASIGHLRKYNLEKMCRLSNSRLLIGSYLCKPLIMCSSHPRLSFRQLGCSRPKESWNRSLENGAGLCRNARSCSKLQSVFRFQPLSQGVMCSWLLPTPPQFWKCLSFLCRLLKVAFVSSTSEVHVLC